MRRTWLIATLMCVIYVIPALLTQPVEAGHVIDSPADCTGQLSGKIVCIEVYHPEVRDQLFIRDVDQLSASDSAAVRAALLAAQSDWNDLDGPQSFSLLPEIGDAYNFLKPANPPATGGAIAVTLRCGVYLGTPDVCTSDLNIAMNAEWTEVLVLVDPAYPGVCFPCESFAGQKRVIAHEWGHVLGLRHHGSCTDPSPTLMCGGNDPGIGQQLSSVEAGSTTDCKSGSQSHDDDGIRCIYDWYNCSDSDCDNVASDNCPFAPNQSQKNQDRNFVSNAHPDYSFADDATWTYSDTLGDVCDSNDDNDGRSTADELTSGTCGSFGTTDPLKYDTDGDRYTDYIECFFGTNPNSASSTAFTACNSIPNVDTDGDRLGDIPERCKYGTDPNTSDTDGDRLTDGARDGCEVGDLNGDRYVRSGDQLMLGQLVASAGQDYILNIDLTKDGGINSADQLWLSFLINPAGQCP